MLRFFYHVVQLNQKAILTNTQYGRPDYVILTITLCTINPVQNNLRQRNKNKT